MKRLILAIVVLSLGFGGVAAASSLQGNAVSLQATPIDLQGQSIKLQLANIQLQGYMTSAVTNHNNIVQATEVVCSFPNGSTQIESNLQIDGTTTVFPNCIN